MNFIPDFKPPGSHTSKDLWFVFEKGKLLTKTTAGRHDIPDGADLASIGVRPLHEQYFGVLQGRSCYAGTYPGGSDLPDGFCLRDLRALLGHLEEDLIWVAGRANHLLHWHRIHRFCGRCGSPTQSKADERALVCRQCGLVNYPRLSPAVIVAVTRNDRILLARNKGFRIPFYSVLAGFVEPGETLEACAVREIKEEVGISVKDIRYFGSQPWPFPDSLMIGFTAVHAGGEIRVDNVELVDAAWFSRDDLPEIPPPISIARHLIDAFVQGH